MQPVQPAHTEGALKQQQQQQQQQQQGVGQPHNDIASHAAPSKGTVLSDPSDRPTLPYQKPRSQAEDLPPEVKAKIAQALPPSKLLNSNPEPEPRNPDLLRRKDSDTLEVDEFHDAQS
jgi:hypothetical protein